VPAARRELPDAGTTRLLSVASHGATPVTSAQTH
jgi:hypothetical protein